jgi:MoaA/NifB/PqqE/SkfB family radical SAM enzyme
MLDLLVYAKEKGIISSVLSVVTQENIYKINDIAAQVIKRGIIFDMGLYQHVGGAFSPKDTSLKPLSMEELENLRKKLRALKLRSGLVAPSWSYLTENLALYASPGWKCSYAADAYLVVNNDGTLMTCQEYPEHIPVLSITSLSDTRWRTSKKNTVISCQGCFYGCYYQKQHIRFIDLVFDAYAMIRL